jgi:hypothetical protein
MSTLIELAERRGRILERIAAQRAALAQDLAPLSQALAATRRVTERYRSVLAWLRERPLVTGLLVAGVVLLRPQRSWRLARWGLLGWQLWKRFGDRPQ